MHTGTHEHSELVVKKWLTFSELRVSEAYARANGEKEGEEEEKKKKRREEKRREERDKCERRALFSTYQIWVYQGTNQPA